MRSNQIEKMFKNECTGRGIQRKRERKREGKKRELMRQMTAIAIDRETGERRVCSGSKVMVDRLKCQRTVRNDCEAKRGKGQTNELEVNDWKFANRNRSDFWLRIECLVVSDRPEVPAERFQPEKPLGTIETNSAIR
jgi:hypothetical protein